MSAMHCHGKASSTEPAILYAILAVGAVHEKELARTEPCNFTNEEASECQSSKTADYLSLLYYNKSISLLQPHFTKPGTESTRVALIVCTIFVCLEFMQKRYKNGFLHFGYSLKLLGNLLRNRTSAMSSDPADDWFAEEIPRLDLQAALLLNEFYSGAACSVAFIWHQLPQAFQTTRDASHSLDGLLFRAHKLQRNGSTINLSEDPVDIFELLATQQALRNDLEGWLRCFDVFKARSWSHLSDAEKLVCRRLPIYHTMAHIIANTALNPRNELIFDLYTHQFASVVSHAREILDIIQPSSSELPTPAADTPGSHVPEYAVNIGLSPPLFYTAIKCRVPRIRRQAVELILLGQRHEGIWDAELSARVAREVITIEERGVQDSPRDGKRDSPDPLSTIPNPPRVHRLWIAAPGNQKGDIHLSIQRIQNGEMQETLTRRFDPVNASWTSYPVDSHVPEAINHERGD
ncbi:C6 zinc finger domain-containing protein [Colletotrichum graminicola M1.001]|uniref:C6 zinc finger domain-containing protein n=1 Tax=Colletotrichum graminicola (strain M1.001 / M2 / FGSC 10212) TaxID=645133 RepID=E3Q5C2_COLGM|nr:C6 zinc finger domain-containing protein [Colletotrichum graminicola M1.001]EFQ25889.1 C6 zinc finger domain-containing protein [Colletotrichum graminicola M1.001]